MASMEQEPVQGVPQENLDGVQQATAPQPATEGQRDEQHVDLPAPQVAAEAQASRDHGEQQDEGKGVETRTEGADIDTPVEPSVEADEVMADAEAQKVLDDEGQVSAPLVAEVAKADAPGVEASDASAPAEEALFKDAQDVPAAEETHDAQPEVAQGEPAQCEVPLASEPRTVEKVHANHKTPAKSRKLKIPSLEASASKVKSLQARASLAEASVSDELKKVEDLRARIDEIEAGIVSLRAQAAAEHAAAQKASQDYLRQQCQASIAHLEACIPKRPPNIFMMFRAENCVQGMATHEQNKILTEKWNNCSDEGKQKYKDRHAAEMKKFNEWNASEDGQKNLRERNELIRQCKAASTEELDRAVEASKTTAKVSSVKRKSEDAENGEPETPVKESRPEMPSKQRRVTASSAPTKEPFLDAHVLEEASKAQLEPQLRNLASRPDVLSLGKTSQELLDVLKAKNGMVNAAKHALLST